MQKQAAPGLSTLLERRDSTAKRAEAIRSALAGRGGRRLRGELGRWVTRLVPVESLVPDTYARWRPLVSDAMQFVVSRLSAARLAEKIVEQYELPVWTPPEFRLLRLIAKVPGLQKIGQVLARNHRLDARLRSALAELENGISDVTPGEIRAMIFEQLGERLEEHEVRVAEGIFSEASVSAVVRFTWRNPETRRRERGVFKVLKPHIPESYAEDMKILEDLAGHLAKKHASGRIRLSGVAETLTEIRLLLGREVDFRREQRTLAGSLEIYREAKGVRVPRLIEPLSTEGITALTEEAGVKVTSAFRRGGANRRQVAKRLGEVLLAAPALAPEEHALFHADPHAGNLLYDRRRGEIVILDWALTERLMREQRKGVFMLVLMMALRDADGLTRAIDRLRQRGNAKNGRHKEIIRRHVNRTLDSLPLFHVPGPLDAMQLLDDIALDGVRFPAALLMYRKAAFTLEGVLEDVAGVDVGIDSVVARYALANWWDAAMTLWYLLSLRDWLALDWSALTFLSRWSLRAARWAGGTGIRACVAFAPPLFTAPDARAGLALEAPRN